MPTKEQIAKINSRKKTIKGFSEKSMHKAGCLALIDIIKQKCHYLKQQ